MAGRARIGISTTQALRLSPGLTTGLAILRMDSATLAAAVDEMAAANPWLQRQDAPPPVVWTPRWCGASVRRGPS